MHYHIRLQHQHTCFPTFSSISIHNNNNNTLHKISPLSPYYITHARLNITLFFYELHSFLDITIYIQIIHDNNNQHATYNHFIFSLPHTLFGHHMFPHLMKFIHFFHSTTLHKSFITHKKKVEHMPLFIYLFTRLGHVLHKWMI